MRGNVHHSRLQNVIKTVLMEHLTHAFPTHCWHTGSALNSSSISLLCCNHFSSNPLCSRDCDWNIFWHRNILQILSFCTWKESFNVAILHLWHQEWLFVMFSVALSFRQLRSAVCAVPLRNLPMSNNGFHVFLFYFWPSETGNMMLRPSGTLTLFSLTMVWNLIVFWQLFSMAGPIIASSWASNDSC